MGFIRRSCKVEVSRQVSWGARPSHRWGVQLGECFGGFLIDSEGLVRERDGARRRVDAENGDGQLAGSGSEVRRGARAALAVGDEDDVGLAHPSGSIADARYWDKGEAGETRPTWRLWPRKSATAPSFRSTAPSITANKLLL
jgi:hypothetical protein